MECILPAFMEYEYGKGLLTQSLWLGILTVKSDAAQAQVVGGPGLGLMISLGDSLLDTHPCY